MKDFTKMYNTRYHKAYEIFQYCNFKPLVAPVYRIIMKNIIKSKQVEIQSKEILEKPKTRGRELTLAPEMVGLSRMIDNGELDSDKMDFVLS